MARCSVWTIGMGAVIAIALTGCMYPDGTYREMVAHSMRAEQKFAGVYAVPRQGRDVLAIPGHPFTADRTRSEWAWRGAPTDRPLSATTVMLARDRDGRTRYAWAMGPDSDVRVMVYDPVTHRELSYVIYKQGTGRMVAGRCVEPRVKDLPSHDPGLAPTIGNGANGNFSRSSGMAEARGMQDSAFMSPPDNHHRELGVKTVNGVKAVGLLTHDFSEGLLWPRPPHWQRPPQSYRETWFSTELGLQVLETSQTYGESKINVSTHNIRLGDPDPQLFEVPKGYTVNAKEPMCS